MNSKQRDGVMSDLKDGKRQFFLQQATFYSFQAGMQMQRRFGFDLVWID